MSKYAVVKTIKIKTNEIKTNIKIKELENFQVEEAVKHNSAKLDETLTKVDLLILISQFTKPNHANQSYLPHCYIMYSGDWIIKRGLGGKGVEDGGNLQGGDQGDG